MLLRKSNFQILFQHVMVGLSQMTVYISLTVLSTKYTNIMTQIRRFTDFSIPDTFILLEDGSYYYNFDIKQVMVPGFDGKEDKQGYSYSTVKCYGRPEYKECVKNIIRMHISQEEEFDLINSANVKILQGDVDNTDPDIIKYQEYLNLVSDIKNKVKQDFNK